MPQASSSRFRTETRLERMARAWPSRGVLGRVRRGLKPLFEAAIGWRRGGAVESRFPGGERVRVRPRWRNLSWNPEEYAAFRGATQPGDVVIDAGANAGGYAVLFGTWAGPAGRVYAFEPDPRAFAALEDHVRLNGLAGRVIPVHAAVTAQPGRVRLRLAAASGVSRLADSGSAPRADDLEVAAVSIDEFCARSNIRPSIIKVDVEGAELDVLRGARNTIAAAGPDVRVFVEMHPEVWRQTGITPADIMRECDASGLVIEHLDGSLDRLWDVEGVCLRLRASGSRT